MRIARSALVISLVLPALLLIPNHVVAFCEILEPPSSFPTQVNGTQVEIRLTEGFARVVIIKEFYNPSNEPKQGQIFFPLEKGHELITDLRLKIGNVVYNSSAGDRGGALDDFLTAIAQGQDAALVQYDPPRDVYWIAVTIPPKETRTTITTLEMPLAKRDGSYDYHYRLSVDARDSVAYLRVHLRVETATPLVHVHLLSHPDVPVLRIGDRAAEAYINDTGTVQGRDLDVHFGAASSALAQWVDPQGERYVRYSIDAWDPSWRNFMAPMPRSLLVAVDASGSMGLDDRWSAAEESVSRLAADLHPGETFNVVAFGGPSVRTLDSVPREWTPGRSADLDRFLASLTPHGSTSFADPLAVIDGWARTATALHQQPIFVLISDGRPSRGLEGLELERAFSEVAYDRTMPIFALATKPATHADESLLRNLSHFQSGDLFTLHGDDTAAQVGSLLGSIRVPMLVGVRSDLPMASDAVFANANPQTVVQGGEAIVLAKLSGGSADPIDVRLSWTGAGAAQALERTASGTGVPLQSLLGRQWVLLKIHGMLAALRAHEDPATLDALKALATENRVVTPYTSLLVVIPRTDPGSTEASPAAADRAFAGIGGGLFAAPASSGRGGPIGVSSPLEIEGRKAEALRQDLANPLVADNELDRRIFAGSPEDQQIDPTTAVIRFQGTYVRVLEVGNELVGVFPDDFRGLSLYPTTFGMALSALSLAALFVVRRRRPSASTAG